MYINTNVGGVAKYPPPPQKKLIDLEKPLHNITFKFLFFLFTYRFKAKLFLYNSFI